jgi:hypothetical protein
MPSATEGPERLSVDVDIGGGLRATSVQVTTDGGPIVLVQVRRGSPAVLERSRLDLHKHMFIDPLPGQRDKAAVQRLSLMVMDQLEHHLAQGGATGHGRSLAGGAR